MTQKTSLDLIRKTDRMTIGIELPLDNDWSDAGARKREADGRPFGVPDLSRQADLIRQIDETGFAAVWARDVPVFDSVNMGDAGSVHDVFTLLGYLAAITRNVALGSAAIVLPIRHPMMTAKAAASVDALSDGRLILGVASGDRPVEYPLLGLDFDARGDSFREAVDYLKAAWQPGGLPVNGQRVPEYDLLPRPVHGFIPMVVAGQARQSDDWLAANMQGRFVYPGGVGRMTSQSQSWRLATGGQGAFISAFHLDLVADPDTPNTPLRFGGRMGRHALIDLFRRYAAAGVDHIAINLRQSSRELPEVLDEISTKIIPALADSKSAGIAA